ncbi:aminoglycoside 6'-N-acetyltransferase [Niallia endozanthoxylica]|uniref:Aminoglycoside N(6')-acetyltransferase type 1 n=1 Tax=Niallia endozanthoxylica TaxID=2036016 RepID=A0A5J5HSQ3_9BACI|nr:aminoglycoside 6'-N-acetyltransferase [Niallia endozanthoxylica]KAA9023891.1 GNAT family N-acetyltransferase [Niallia endozanthoxylica]
MEIVRATDKEITTIVRLALKLWPEADSDEHTQEYKELMQHSEAVVFLSRDADTFVGFAQCQLRTDYVEGTENSPVGYLEGIFVEDTYRRKGIAKQLLAACEDWARQQGCTEFGSDVEIQNLDSLRFHLKNGFHEANRIICLAKKL